MSDQSKIKQAIPVAAAAGVGILSSLFLWRYFSTPEEQNLILRVSSKEDEEKLMEWLRKRSQYPSFFVDLEEKNEEGLTPLLIAVREKRAEVTRFLLEKGADDTQPCQNGWKAIHYACQNGIEGDSAFDALISHRTSNALERNENTLWTSLHVSTSKGNLYQVKKLLELGANPNAEVDSGFTPLIIASGNGFSDLVDIFLRLSPNLEAKATPFRKTALSFATLGGHLEIVKKLVKAGANVATTTTSGNTPLYDAASVGSLPLVTYYLSLSDVDVNASKTDGTRAIHAATSRGHTEVARYLLEKGATTEDRDNFGQTPLHVALWSSSMDMARILIEFGADVNQMDYDGSTPLHNLTRASIRGKEGAKIEDQLAAAKLLLEKGAKVDGCGDDECTALHIASCGGKKGASMAKFLLENGADVFKETAMGWTPLHFACSEDGSPEVEQIIRGWIKEKDPSFFDTFNPKKPKKELKRKVKAPTLSEEKKKEVLDGDVTLDGIAKKIKSGNIKKILVLTGAGISVSAGIPDFRSQDGGIYSTQTMEKYNLPSPAAAFDLNYLANDPAPFYAICRDIFYPVKTGQIKPTPMHKLIRLFQDKGILLRNYTQNVDNLEIEAGIDEKLLVEAHGSFKSARCMNCKDPADMDYFWNQVSVKDVPVCTKCFGTVRPDVTFFGEGMPSRFLDMHLADLRDCDLLIVAGTSLVVYPFAGLVNQVSENVPRLLLNKKNVGVFKSYEDSEDLRDGNYRDVAYIGACDDGALELIEKLGWLEDYQKL